MTAKQKAAREKFKKVVAEAGKLRKKNPKLTQAQAVKQAFAMQKKVGAIKIIEKGETKSAKAKSTYQQVRTKKGTFKGLKKIAGVNKKYTNKQLEKIANDYAYVTSGDVDKLTYRLLDKDNTQKLLPIYLKSISDFEKKYNMKISGIKKKSSAAPKKKSAASKRITDIHKDSKSHNVNIRVVSGLHTIGEIEPSDFTRISNDVNGNPRYVIHFLQLLNDQERLMPFNEKFDYALKKAKKMGGRKFSNKQYGGGVVFQSYNIYDLAKKLEKLKNS